MYQILTNRIVMTSIEGKRTDFASETSSSGVNPLDHQQEKQKRKLILLWFLFLVAIASTNAE